MITKEGKAGWLDKNYTAYPQPEPNAKLYHVKEGMAAQKDIISHYKKQGYFPTSDFDDRDIFKSVTIANEGRIGIGVYLEKYEQKLNSLEGQIITSINSESDKRITHSVIDFLAGANIWLPSLSHLKQLVKEGRQIKKKIKKKGKLGRISSPAKDYELVKSTGVRIRETPNSDGRELGRLKYNTTILVRELDETGQWAFVIATDGKAGWLNKNYTAYPQPEPNAKLYHVKEGMAAQRDILSYYQSQGYSPEIGFDDKDIYKAITIANEGRIGAGINMKKYKESKNNFWNKVKNLIDREGDKRATYQAISFTAGTNIWLPSFSHIEKLKKNGTISSRSDWLDAGIAAGKGVAAFSDGLISGFLGGIWDALSGLWDLSGEIVNMIGKVVTGEILGDIKNIYNFFKGLTPEKAKKIASMLLGTIMKAMGDFKANWNNRNFYNKWEFRGKVVGNILLELVLTIFTGGAGNLLKWLGKLKKVAPKLVAVFRRVANGLDKVIPDNLKRKDRDADEKGETTREKQYALLAAKVITEKHDTANSSISTLMASLLPIKKKYKSVKRFEVEKKKGQPGHYKVWMIASKLNVDQDYTPSPEEKELESLYQNYVSRKTKAGKTPRSRADWEKERDYWLNDSPMARGNAFNRKAVDEDWYPYNEVNLGNGKRLDAYDPDAGEIISRKATNLDNISMKTYETYLKEMATKYAPGTPIKSPKYGTKLKGKVLEGKMILEIPSVNSKLKNIESFKAIAKKHNIELKFRSE